MEYFRFSIDWNKMTMNFFDGETNRKRQNIWPEDINPKSTRIYK